MTGIMIIAIGATVLLLGLLLLKGWWLWRRIGSEPRPDTDVSDPGSCTGSDE